jgi:hypothetical protein
VLPIQEALNSILNPETGYRTFVVSLSHVMISEKAAKI